MTDKTSASSTTQQSHSGSGAITVNWPKALTTGSDTAFLLGSPQKEEEPSEAETTRDEPDTWGGFGGL